MYYVVCAYDKLGNVVFLNDKGPVWSLFLDEATFYDKGRTAKGMRERFNRVTFIRQYNRQIGYQGALEYWVGRATLS